MFLFFIINYIQMNIIFCLVSQLVSVVFSCDLFYYIFVYSCYDLFSTFLNLYVFVRFLMSIFFLEILLVILFFLWFDCITLNEIFFKSLWKKGEVPNLFMNSHFLLLDKAKKYWSRVPLVVHWKWITKRCFHLNAPIDVSYPPQF